MELNACACVCVWVVGWCARELVSMCECVVLISMRSTLCHHGSRLQNDVVGEFFTFLKYTSYIVQSTQTNCSGLFGWERKWELMMLVVVMHIKNDNEHKMFKFVMRCMNTWLAQIHSECMQFDGWVGRNTAIVGKFAKFLIFPKFLRFFLVFTPRCFYSGPGQIELILCKSIHEFFLVNIVFSSPLPCLSTLVIFNNHCSFAFEIWTHVK